jgi:gluconolactonase
VFAWDLAGPGEVASAGPVGHGGQLLAGLPGLQLLDSLAVDGEGWVCVGTLVNGGITAISPDGSKARADTGHRRSWECALAAAPAGFSVAASQT